MQSGNTMRTDGNTSESPLRADPAVGSMPSAQSTLGLVSHLIGELSALFRHEIALARAEIRESAQRATAGVVSIAIGAFVLFIALLTTVAAGVLALALVLPAWLAALAIGAGMGAIGYGIFRSGRRRLDMSNLKLTRAPESLRKDAATLTRKHQP